MPPSRRIQRSKEKEESNSSEKRMRTKIPKRHARSACGDPHDDRLANSNAVRMLSKETRTKDTEQLDAQRAAQCHTDGVAFGHWKPPLLVEKGAARTMSVLKGNASDRCPPEKSGRQKKRIADFQSEGVARVNPTRQRRDVSTSASFPESRQ